MTEAEEWFVTSRWVAERIDAPEVVILDPRSPVKYLQGHLKNAVNLPTLKYFEPQEGLLAPEQLATLLGEAGLGEGKQALVYDAFDGQSGAMLVFILEYLGYPDIRLMEIFFEGWVEAGQEIFYRPVSPGAGHFQPRINSEIQVTQQDILADPKLKLVDFRSREEFSGEKSTGEDRPGHIPKAVNIVWQELLGSQHHFLGTSGELKELFSQAGISPTDKTVAYCRMGPRAAIGYLALRRLGYQGALYPGSFAEWSATSQPVSQ